MSEAIIYRSSNIQGAGVFGYAPNPATNLTAKRGNAKVELKWTDPDDRVVEGTNVGWSYTRIVRKTGSYPTGPNDGTIVVQNSTKNQYQNSAYVDTGVTNGTTYYYAAYSCSDYGIFAETAPTATARPTAYKTMTVKINELESNPANMCTYADDAVNMPSGKTEDAISAWQNFFKYKPCVLKDGQVLGDLNPNDYSKFEDGSSNNTAATDRTVMIEFPRHGLNISKNGNTVTISMTEDPDDPDFTYYAHTRGTKRCNHFYLSAYLLSAWNSALEDTYDACACDPSNMSSYAKDQESWSNAIHNYHGQDSGYEMYTWFQYVYITAMYLLQFKNPDADSIFSGNQEVNDDVVCGTRDKDGLFADWKEKSWDPIEPVKIFGLEYMYGCPWYVMIGGVWKTGTTMYFQTDNIGNYSHSDYSMTYSYSGGQFTEKIVGTSLGFALPTEGGSFSSSSTYYAAASSISGSTADRGTVMASPGNQFYEGYTETRGRNPFALSVLSSSSQSSNFTRLSFYN